MLSSRLVVPVIRTWQWSSGWHIILLVLFQSLFVATGVFGQLAEASPPVYFNHITIFLSPQTYAAILQSPFLRDEFSAFQERTVQRDGGAWSYTGIFISGQHTYLELFKAGPFPHLALRYRDSLCSTCGSTIAPSLLSGELNLRSAENMVCGPLQHHCRRVQIPAALADLALPPFWRGEIIPQ
jgi:hypothetical protein